MSQNQTAFHLKKRTEFLTLIVIVHSHVGNTEINAGISLLLYLYFLGKKGKKENEDVAERQWLAVIGLIRSSPTGTSWQL